MLVTIKVINYEAPNGSRPFEEWFKGLDVSIRSIVLARLNRVRLGNFGDCKPVVGSKVFELRIDYGPGYRVYFGRQGRHLVIILGGGSKRTQNADIKKANKYWQDYKSRASEN